MIKTRFIFTVSFMAMFVVNAAVAAASSVTSSAPVSGTGQAISGTVGTVGDVYDWSQWNGYATEGIASVSYVNNAVDAAGNAAQWAESHAAAAGTSAASAADSASKAAASAKSANDALKDKQDKLSASQLNAVNSGVTADIVAEAQSAVQKDEVTTGATNGTIKVQDKEVAVAGLGSAAYTNSNAYDVAGAATAAVEALDSGVEAKSGEILTGFTVVDGKVTESTTMKLETTISDANDDSSNAPTTAAMTGYVQSQIDAFSENSFSGVATGLQEAQLDIKSIKESAYANSGVTADIVAEAQSAVQKDEVTTGATNGTIKVQDKEVAVAGLGSAAYTNSNAYDVAGAATTAVEALDSSVNVEENKVITGLTVVDGKITAAEKMALTALASFPVACNDSDTHCALTINGGTLAWEVVK